MADLVRGGLGPSDTFNRVAAQGLRPNPNTYWKWGVSVLAGFYTNYGHKVPSFLVLLGTLAIYRLFAKLYPKNDTNKKITEVCKKAVSIEDKLDKVVVVEEELEKFLDTKKTQIDQINHIVHATTQGVGSLQDILEKLNIKTEEFRDLAQDMNDRLPEYEASIRAILAEIEKEGRLQEFFANLAQEDFARSTSIDESTRESCNTFIQALQGACDNFSSSSSSGEGGSNTEEV